jgi:photosystem II stability/assembly factor-like uncharacterized protein
MNRRDVQAVAVAPDDGNILYAAAGGRVYRSADGGQTWTAVLPCGTNPPPCCGCIPLLRVLELVVHPRNPQIVFAVTYLGLYKSVDGGARWRRVPVGTGSITTLVFEPGKPKVLYTAGQGRIFKSTDGGSSWVPWNESRIEVSTQHLVIDPGDPRRMWTGGSSSLGVYRSTDGGVHWRAFRSGLPNFNADALALGPAPGAPIVWIGNSDGVFRSLDGGITWKATLRNRFIASIAVHPVRPEILWVGTHPEKRSTSGVFKTVNRGATWTFSSRGIFNAETFSVAFDPVTPGVLWTANLSGAWRSADGGSTWSDRSGNIPRHLFVLSLTVDPDDPETVWAGTSEGVFVTQDGGATWEARREGMTGFGANPFAAVQFLRLATSNPSVAYAGTTNTLFKTIDAGAHWTPVPSPPFDPPATFIPGDLLIDPRVPDVVFVVQGDLWSSRDGGVTWSKVPVPVEKETIRRVAADPRDPDILYVGGEQGVLRSPDGGQTWQLVTDLLISWYGQIAVGPAGEVWAGDLGGVYFSPDGLSGWTLLPGLHAHVLSALEADPHHPSTVVASTSDILAPGTLEGLFRHTGD